jgi:hypothetical protein
MRTDSATISFSWLDDRDRSKHFSLAFGLLLSLSPACLVDHHVGLFRFDPESFCRVFFGIPHGGMPRRSLK